MPKRSWPHVDDPISVGRRLKEARLAAGLSQRELSFPGCTAVYICRIERGDRVPSLQVLRQLAERLDVDEGYLATGTADADKIDPLLDADVALRLEQLELAERLYTEALEAAPAGPVRARALAGLGEIDLHGGRASEAVERLEEAAELLGAAVVEHPGIVEALTRAHVMRGDDEAAISTLEGALKLVRQRDDDQTEMRLSVLLANALIDDENLEAARQILAQSVEQALGLADPALQARLYWSQSRLHAAEHNSEAASRYARMALASVVLTENVEYAARAHLLLAHVELESGNAEEALELLEQGRALADRTGSPEVEGRFKVEKARVLEALGRDDEAVALALEAAAELEKSRPDQAGRAQAVAADVYAARGERPRALELYELALEHAADRQSSFARGLYAKMAELLEAEGRKDEALDLLKRAVAPQSKTSRPS